jgi:hypothetical protein
MKAPKFFICIVLLTIINILLASIRPIYASDNFPVSRIKENKLPVLQEDVFDKDFSANNSSLFAESHSSQLKSEPEIFYANDIEISGHGCSVGVKVESRGASILAYAYTYTYMSLPDLPRQTLSIFVPQFRKNTITLESDESVVSESHKACNQAINSAKQIDILFRIRKIMSNSELETNIQNSWKWKD